jgi:hypothetical protein
MKVCSKSFASRQLKDHEINYSPFLLEAATAVWGMDFFNEYLKGKRFILYTDHKPLEKLGHLHSKTINRLQMALLEHDFVIQYKKGSNMPGTTFLDYQEPRTTSPASQLLILSKQISSTSRCKMRYCKASRPSGTPANGHKQS